MRAPFPLTEDEPLAPWTTLGIGGRARYFTRPRSVAAVRAALAWAAERELPVLVLGGGSNVLVADSGFPGLVLRLELRGVRVAEEEAGVRVEAAAGEGWDALVATAVARRWSGVECLSGIPGLVGATPIQNVGAYGQEVSDTLVEVTALERGSGELIRFAAGECGFGYRTSRFKGADRDRYVVCGVAYRLSRAGAAEVRYPELRRELAAIARPTVEEVRRAVLAVRRRKGMVLDPGDPDSRSAGSFFVNPLLSPAELAALRARVGDPGAPEQEPPFFRQLDGRVKVPAAWLIERAGFRRGHVHGNVGISGKHALAIVNRGGGTAAEILELVRSIQARVRDRLGVELALEPVPVGFG